MLEEWGWFVMKVFTTDSEPAFAYSLGLYERFKHPEIILFGLDLDVMHRLINDAAEQIRQGERYEVGRRYDDLLAGYGCEFRQVDSKHCRRLLTYAFWYYKGSAFPALQLIWPDPEGRFPWDAGFEERFRSFQPNLD